MLRSLVLPLIYSLLLFLFLYTGLSKMLALDHFRATLMNHRFGEGLVSFLTVSIPALEVGAAGLLLFSKTRLAGLYLSLGILLLFTGYTVYILAYRPGPVPCSCGGLLETLDWKQHLWFNASFVLLTFLGIRLQVQQKKTEVNRLETEPSKTKEILV